MHESGQNDHICTDISRYQVTISNPSSVFLVSGGAKGITAQCVIRLAQRYRCKWILLGRSENAPIEPAWVRDSLSESELKKRIMEDLLAQGEKPTPMKVQKVFNTISSRREIQKTLSTLEQVGSQAEYLSVDVTNPVTLREKLAVAVERLGPITGIIHGAGNLADKLIEKKTEQDFETVFAAKVKGLENLLSSVSLSQLDYLVLFSSVAGFYGNAGQTDYAIANEILNKSAHLVKQYHPNCHVVAINWGPWDSGMVTPELKKAFAQRNIEVIPIEVGAQMLVEELSAAHHETAQVIIGSPLTPPAEALDPELRSYRIRRRLTLEANPFLQDHVIGGNPVLPATCAVSWIINSCEQLYPGYKFFRLENFQVLKGIVFDGTQANEFILDVREVTKTDANEVTFEVRIWSEKEKGKIRFHYTGLVELRQQSSASPVYNPVDNTSSKTITGLSLYQSKTLFHGLTFQGIERVLDINEKSLTMQCILPKIENKQQGQFRSHPFNPYTADVLVQSALIWSQHLHQVGCLPSEIQQITQFKSIPFDQHFWATLEIKIKTETQIICDITTYDSLGEIYMHLSGVKFTISKSLKFLEKK
ncbi:SDR family NAD(P)-dependent oxidoreductase [Brasilonema sp. UFV-L1]|uniref:SDR family NAD(P)-dependent oxidoreductase n=1 Tax=Brasilonema sp. UFV-L1 TaxID=2234130 RepID=UPI002006EB00|nr:SDR family NAD(P)-dependent oxidoreductase [Brasilonema sp. UFV-L1]